MNSPSLHTLLPRLTGAQAVGAPSGHMLRVHTDSRSLRPQTPRVGDAAFRAQRAAIERAQTALRTLAAQARKAGRGFPLPDGYIAAIAAARGMYVATRDTGPYQAVPSLQVINPWE